MKTEREKWDRFLDKHGSVNADAFFWCSGRRWEDRRYCAVILAKAGTLTAAIEVSGDTPKALAARMRDAGYPARSNVIAPLCESAERSPRKPREVIGHVHSIVVAKRAGHR